MRIALFGLHRSHTDATPKRHWRVSRWLVAASVVLASPAWAERQQRLSLFDQGRKNFETGNYVRALELFGAVVTSNQDPETKARAYYFQGLALFEMGLYYSSFVAFANLLSMGQGIGKEVVEKAIKNAVSIGDRLYMVARVGKSLETFPATSVPPSVLAHYHYAVGVAKLESGNHEGSVDHFKAVNPESPFFPKALMYLGIASSKSKNYPEAGYYFDKVMELTRGRKDQYQLQELGRLNFARTAYSAGDIERAIDLYSQFLANSPHWTTVLLEASWPLMRVSDTTVSLGNLHTLLSPFYREDLVGEAYVLRSTILFSLCKYEEMRQTLALFFQIYDPVLRDMQREEATLGSPDAFFRAFTSERGINRAFHSFARRDPGIAAQLKVIETLRQEKDNVAALGRVEVGRRMMQNLEQTERSLQIEIGAVLQRMHRRKLAELKEQREQANYLKVEIVTGEKELIEAQKGLPAKRIVDVETTVAPGYNYWPFNGEYWEDELGTFVYTSESSCVN
jgi:tetratricopeptide (TPR) repeat protein